MTKIENAMRYWMKEMWILSSSISQQRMKSAMYPDRWHILI